jgi:hypothetical protein
MCTVLLPPGVNPTAVNRYIDINVLMKPEFSRQIFEKRLLSNFMKIRQVGAELLNTTERQISRR